MGEKGAALAACLLALATTASGAHGGHRYAVASGSGELVASLDPVGPRGTLAFNASGSSTGPVGWVRANPADATGRTIGEWFGRVSCIVVSGKDALIGGTITASQGNAVTGRFELRVKDNPETQPSGEDVFAFRAGPTVAGDCVDDILARPPTSLAHGDAYVAKGHL
jgi:hypothetical protein